MSFRFSTIVWMVLLVVAAFGLYMVKFRVQALKAEVGTTEQRLREEKKNLHVLTAEWTFLTNPERLRTLSDKYLTEKPTRGEQLADFTSFPYRLPATARAEPKTGVTLVS